MAYYPNAIFSTFAFIGFLMCMVTFPWQIEAWNTGTCVFMVWAGLGCLNLFVNSVVWSHNYVNWSPVWCDISTKFMIGLNVAIPAASLCISRRLYHISSLKSVTVTQADKRRHVIVDLIIGLGLPVLQMILHYIVQGHRFDIFEDVGCIPSTYFTWPALVIVSCPPLLIGLISAVYAILNIIQFRKLRARINDFPGYNNLTTSRFLRFMCLSSVDILLTIPLSTYNLHGDIQILSPWISWADTHSNFSRVDTIPTLFWRSVPSLERVIEFNRWIVIFCAFVFFGFFGLTDQSRKNYRLFVQVIVKRTDLFTSRGHQRAHLTPIAFQSANHRDNMARSSDQMSGSLHESVNDEISEIKYLENESLDTPIGKEDGRRLTAVTDSSLLPSFPTNSSPSFPSLSKPSLASIDSIISSSPHVQDLASVSRSSYTHEIV